MQVIEKGGSFFAIGGNSLSAVVAVEKLNSAGFFISLNDILRSTDIVRVLQGGGQLDEGNELDDISTQIIKNYDIEIIVDDSYKAAVTDLLSKEFVVQNPLDMLAGTSKEGFAMTVSSIFEQIVHDKLSFVMINKETRSIDACTILLDICTEISPVFEHEEVGEINDVVERPVKERLLREEGQWVDFLLNAVGSGVAGEVRLVLLRRMEDEVIRLARLRGYHGIVTVNSHPVTMLRYSDLCLTIFNVQISVAGFL